MTNLKATSHLVKYILENDPQTRNSDSFLYLKVLENIASQKDINLHGITVPDFLTSSDLPFPGFETVRRSRQKIQATCPELAACDKVQYERMINEVEFRHFAKDGI